MKIRDSPIVARLVQGIISPANGVSVPESYGLNTGRERGLLMNVTKYSLTQYDLEATISSLQRLVRARKLGHADVLEKRIQKLQAQLSTLTTRRGRETATSHPN